MRPALFLKSGIVRYWPVVIVLSAWQLSVSVTNINSIVIPRPVDVVLDIVGNFSTYVENGLATFLTAAGGLALGMAVGTILAVLVASSRLLKGALTPVTLLFSSVPVVTLIPILGRVFGYGNGTVFIIVAVISYFPAFVFTASGLTAFTKVNDDLFTVLGAGYFARLLNLSIPAAVPSWMVALRLTAPSAFLSAMVAEYLLGRGGLGFLFRQSATTFDTARAFGTSLIATAIAIGVFGLTAELERKVHSRWR